VMFYNATSFDQDLGSWILNSNVNMAGMFLGTSMSCINASATLVGWEHNNPTVTGRTLGATGLDYGTKAQDAVDALIARGWTITGLTDTSPDECSFFEVDAVANDLVDENSTYTSSAAPTVIAGRHIGAFTYSLLGDDAGDFTVNAATGVVSMAPRNYENPLDTDLDNKYEVTLRTMDEDGNYDDASWTVEVRDVVETIEFSLTSSSGDENVSSTTIEVILNAAIVDDASVNYTVTGTATGGGVDYTLANGTLTIPSGGTSVNLTIPSIVDDAIEEPNETIVVTLASPSNAALGTNVIHTYTILDDDMVTVAFDSISSSGNEDVGTVSIPVNISDASLNDVSVNYAVSGTATGGGTDYTLADGTLTILAGSTSENIVIPSIFDDAIDEPDETIVIMLSNPTNALLGTNAIHTYTIVDNDVSTIANFTINEIPDLTWMENSRYTSEKPELSGDTPLGLVTFTVGGADAASFSVDSIIGTVSLNEQDFELPGDVNGDNTFELTLIATDEMGNFDIEAWAVTILDVDENQLIIPTAFTPNGDQENDVWEIPNLSEDASVTIFNRNGTVVFVSDGYTVPWDGTYQNQRLPAGTYYYTIKDRSNRHSGYVMIMR
ncbi:MAG: Calx-beta domain-containing protein, partial [Bacteroidota bacterium]